MRFPADWGDVHGCGCNGVRAVGLASSGHIYCTVVCSVFKRGVCEVRCVCVGGGGHEDRAL